MNATEIQENQLMPGANPNILPIALMFDSVYPYTTLGSGSAASNQTSNVFAGPRSLRLKSSVTNGATVSPTDSSFQHTISESGIYTLAFRLFEASGTNTNSTKVTVRVFVNGTPTDIDAFTISPLVDGLGKDQYRTFYAQLSLAVGDVLNYQFQISPSDVGSVYVLYIDGMQLKKENFPSQFSSPIQTFAPPVPTADGLYGLRIASGVASWESIS